MVIGYARTSPKTKIRICRLILLKKTEFQRSSIVERTQEGLAAARARGRKGGRPKALVKEKRDDQTNL